MEDGERQASSAPAVPLFHWRSYRLYILILLMITFTITSNMYMNLGITITCMVNASAYETRDSTISTKRLDECPAVSQNSEELGYTGDLLWTPWQQSQLFAVFFYASLLSMGISGWLSDRFNAKMIIVTAIGVYTATSLFSPLLARWHFYAFLASRFLMGITEGFVFPCMTTIVSRWCPPQERSTAAAIYTSGHQIAALMSAFVSAKLCSFHFLGGWPLIFYTFGVSGAFAAVFCLIFLSNRPEENRFISSKEKLYLHEQLVNEGLKKKHEEKPPVPFKAIFTSPVVYSIVASEVSYQFSSSIFIYYLPSFFRDVMAFDMNQNGYYTSIPFLVQILFKVLISVGADKAKERYGLSSTVSCKALQAASTTGTALVLICMGLFLDCTAPGLAAVLVVLFGAFFSGEVAGAFTATLFIAPSFTGTLSSITILLGTFGGIGCSAAYGLLIQDGTRAEWQRLFFLGAAVNLFSGITFLCFGSAELQPWAVQSGEQKQQQQLSQAASNKVYDAAENNQLGISAKKIDDAK